MTCGGKETIMDKSEITKKDATKRSLLVSLQFQSQSNYD